MKVTYILLTRGSIEMFFFRGEGMNKSYRKKLEKLESVLRLPLTAVHSNGEIDGELSTKYKYTSRFPLMQTS